MGLRCVSTMWEPSWRVMMKSVGSGIFSIQPYPYLKFGAVNGIGDCKQLQMHVYFVIF